MITPNKEVVKQTHRMKEVKLWYQKEMITHLLEIPVWFVPLSAVIMECLTMKYQVSSQCWPHRWRMQYVTKLVSPTAINKSVLSGVKYN